MAAQKKKRQVLFTCETEDQLRDLISEENKKLVVLDVHLGWCGRCENMEQNYRNMYIQYDDIDQNRLKFYSCSEELLTEEMKEEFKHGALSCRPRFLLYCEGEKRDEIDGADFPTLNAAITKNIPSFETD